MTDPTPTAPQDALVATLSKKLSAAIGRDGPVIISWELCKVIINALSTPPVTQAASAGMEEVTEKQIAGAIKSAADAHSEMAFDRQLISSITKRVMALLRTHGDGWRPIETAPKDGTEILLCNENGVSLAAWLDDTIVTGRGHKRIFAWCVPGSWQDEQGGHATIDNPTHWMPLPSPPTSTPQKEAGE